MEKSNFTTEYRLLLHRLCQARRDAGLSQQLLAERLKPTKHLPSDKAIKETQRMQRFISRYETGARRLDIFECYLICKAVEIDFLELMELLAKEWDIKSVKGWDD